MELGTAESKSLIRRKTAKVNSGEWRHSRGIAVWLHLLRSFPCL